MVTSHSQGLSGLTGSTLYHYRVKSKDAAGNPAVSGDFTFTLRARHHGAGDQRCRQFEHHGFLRRHLVDDE